MERARFVAAHFDGHVSVAELVDGFAVSRPTLYTWIERFKDGGAEAIEDRSRTQHAKMSSEAEALIVQARRAHPTCGARKLLPYLATRHDGVDRP